MGEAASRTCAEPNELSSNAEASTTTNTGSQSLLSEEEKQKLFHDIISTVKEDFHDKLKRVANMENIPDSANDGKERSSAPDYAQKMDGAALAMEGLLNDPIRLFQDVIVKRLFEAGKRAEEAGLLETTETEKPLPAFPEPEALVLKESLSTLNDAIIDISDKATSCRFRFINCAQFVHQQTLCIVEYTDITDVPYATTSYIWRGVIGPPTAVMAHHGAFAVKGATDGDPISIDVLLHVCRASLLKEVPLLWLDRLCIVQTSREDKAWQIQQMFRVYSSCKECFVLPGGTRRLASLEEPTMWIHRGWTLQEAVAPKSVSMLISWEFEQASFRSIRRPMGTASTVEEVVPGQSAYIRLNSVVNASVVGDVEFRVPTPETYTGRKIDVSIHIFGNDKETGWRHAFALSEALKPISDTVDTQGDKKRTALWRSAQMRTSSRPVDMVFSIMGLFGVTLNPREFKANDRLGATIALAREILKQGGHPNWFSISLSLPHNSAIYSFPMFPETNEAGVAIYEVDSRRVEAAELMRDVDGWIGTEGVPGAAMDEAGFLTAKLNSAPVRFTGAYHEQPIRSIPKQGYDSQLLQFHDLHRPPFITDQDGKVWEVLSNDSPSRLYVVLLGRMYTQSKTRFLDPMTLVKGILLLEYQEGKFRRFSGSPWFVFNRMSYRFEGWNKRVFTI